MNADQIAGWVLLAIVVCWVLGAIAAEVMREASAKVDRLISDALDERPETFAGLYDHPPIFAEVERDMGPIFAAGVERQAKRFAAELEDDGGIYEWLNRGERS